VEETCNVFVSGFFTSCIVDKFANMNGCGLMYFPLFATLCAIGMLDNVSVMLLAAYLNFGF